MPRSELEPLELADMLLRADFRSVPPAQAREHLPEFLQPGRPLTTEQAHDIAAVIKRLYGEVGQRVAADAWMSFSASVDVYDEGSVESIRLWLCIANAAGDETLSAHVVQMAMTLALHLATIVARTLKVAPLDTHNAEFHMARDHLPRVRQGYAARMRTFAGELVQLLRDAYPKMDEENRVRLTNFVRALSGQWQFNADWILRPLSIDT